MLDLILPLECAAAAPSTRWCEGCAAELVVRPDEPHVVTPRIDPMAPVFAAGAATPGARRRAILACKEHGRADLVAPWPGRW
ncbi:ComF family protein, partial [Mycobacterium interjectum]|nr:ComF family protein [Mycobacterium interjectum]